MKLNRKWIMVIALVMSLTMATAGTLAYLTDRDSEVNTFTVGNVEIELVEDFEQGSELIPGVKIEKEVQINNKGSEDAWVWYTYAVPTALIDTGANASKNAVHFNIPGRNWDTYRENSKYWADGQTEAVPFEQTWHWEKMDVDAMTDDDGIKYTVVTVLYNGILENGATTTAGLEQVYLDTRVDITPEGDMYWVENGVATDLNWNINDDGAPKIYVSAYAIQEEGFETVQEAYAAYNVQWGSNGTEYDGGDEDDEPTIPNGIYTLQDLIDMAKTGGEYVLCTDLNITEDNAVFSSGRKLNVIWEDLTIDLNGHNISVDLGDGEYADASNPPTLFYVYNNATLTIVGDGNLSATNDACLIWASSTSGGTNIYGGNFFNNNLSTGNPNKPNDSMAIIYSSGGPVNVYGGTFNFEVNAENGDNTGFNLQDSSSYVDQIVLHEGVLLSSDNYAWRLDVGRINLAEGCELKEVVIDGTTWYEVVKQ